MGEFGEFGEFGDFYTNYITRDGSNVLANLTIWAISITSRVEAEQKDINFFFTSPEMGLTCWRL